MPTNTIDSLSRSANFIYLSDLHGIETSTLTKVANKIFEKSLKNDPIDENKIKQLKRKVFLTILFGSIIPFYGIYCLFDYYFNPKNVISSYFNLKAFIKYRSEAAIVSAIQYLDDEKHYCFSEIFDYLCNQNQTIDIKTKFAIQRLFLLSTDFWFPIELEQSN